MDFVFENSRPGNSMEVDEKFWKEVESFGKFLFRKGSFLFFRAGARSRRSRPAQALAKRCTFDLTVSCHGQLVHFRSRRGRGPPVHAVDRVHRLKHAAVITRTVNGKGPYHKFALRWQTKLI